MALRRPTFQRQSAALMAYARQCRRAKAAEEAQSSLKAEAHNASSALSAVSALLPGASELLGQPRTGQLGRAKSEREPSHFRLLARAAFLAPRAGMNFGVRIHRVICVVVQLLLVRQIKALTHLIIAAGRLASTTATSSSSGGAFVHLAFTHLWDETKVKAQAKEPKAFRPSKMGMHAQSMVQRGICNVTYCAGVCCLASWGEPWLCQPVQVQSTSAE